LTSNAIIASSFQVLTVIAELEKDEQVKSVVDKAIGFFGRIDILVRVSLTNPLGHSSELPTYR
jgi:NAD(P)-dependent dehydrogenase (short-subunit alcohol dehydrogenase family)